jgi:hypothetical protein
MHLPQEFEPLHETYLRQWGHAEEVLKMVERVKNEAFYPSIKELRYAARRVVDAHNEAARPKPDHESIKVHLIEAIENCRKARHDAVDSAINFIHDELDKLVRLAGLDTVHQAFPSYGALQVRLRDVSELIVQSRKARTALDDKYEEVKREHLTEIVAWYGEMQTAIPVIGAIQRRRKNDFWVSAFVIGVVIGSIVAVGAIALDKRGYLEWMAPAKASTPPKVTPVPARHPG